MRRLLFLTIFVDLIGFGMVLPLLPFYARDYGASVAVVGMVVGIHPAMQFILAPYWGRLSDRVGRKPILLVGLLGSALSYLLFALAPSLGWLFFSRFVAGAVGANITVAQAYMADTTTLENRTRAMGLVGAAFGLGFVIGPAIGGTLSRFGYPAAGFFAAALSFGNVGAAFFMLPESLPRSERAKTRSEWGRGLGERLKLAARLARRSTFRYVMSLVLMVTFIFAALTTVFPLLIEELLGYDARHAGYLLAYLGLIEAIVMGRLIGPLVQRFGERKLVVAGSLMLIFGYGLLPFAANLTLIGIALFLIGLGTGLDWPSLNGLASQYAEADVQGGVMGVLQSLSGLARVGGAVWAGWVFGAWGPGAPFVLSSAIAALAAAVAIGFMIRAPEPPPHRAAERVKVSA